MSIFLYAGNFCTAEYVWNVPRSLNNTFDCIINWRKIPYWPWKKSIFHLLYRNSNATKSNSNTVKNGRNTCIFYWSINVSIDVAVVIAILIVFIVIVSPIHRRHQYFCRCQKIYLHAQKHIWSIILDMWCVENCRRKKKIWQGEQWVC